MNTKFRENHGKWIEIPDDCVLLKGNDCVRDGDLCYTPFYGFRSADEDSIGMGISDFGFHGVVRKNTNLHEGDFYFPTGSLVEVLDEYVHGKDTGRTIFELASPDYEEQDRKRIEAEKEDPHFSQYKVIVCFRPHPSGETYSDLFMSGYNSMEDCFSAGEYFPVEKGYSAFYTVVDENERETITGKLQAGQYRLHNGYVEKRVGLEWIKPKRFR